MGVEEHRLIRRDQVLHICGISRSGLYDLIARGLFPEPVRIGRRAVAWRESEIAAWIESRPLASDTERTQ